ncbi:FAD-dependent oxidoreductase [Dactylosporangium aurantiacum]|uniref:FAD-dependent oxidoreductase n=1 Tax=Dactylosporangium aurantiacum TaxID=35754 RepID=A0A9Q9IM35_9ACTN|nr:FAD-dependent oxidoreductase [Dactylosporangium aurantiacum]MDG6106131.1 FAD-dependent oxidoreductase [Dactylosporangium aurantiacum]UWZ55834.1 FAD-dependent oxidoreductase [Dactylosporangium aurantiacum]
MTRLLIIGGSDAGISAGLRARELDPTVDVTLLVADRYPNFSICGIPYHVSGDVPDWHHLAHRTTTDLETAGLHLRLEHRATAIHPDMNTVTATAPDGGSTVFGYDRLVIGTGAVPATPPIDGLDRLGPADGVHVLHTMDDTFAILRTITERRARQAVIVGAGYIGLEMAEALTTRGLTVTVLEQVDQVMPTLDPELAEPLAEHLRERGVDVRTGTKVRSVGPATAGRLAVGTDTGDHRADLVLVVTGVRPDTELAATAGAALGVQGTIAVDRGMRTNLPDVYAAGDCIHTYHRLLDQHIYLPLGSTAHKQGRVAGANAVGGAATFAGSLGTQAVKVFDRVVAGTGLRDTTARAAGFDPVTVEVTADDHKAYYPGATPIRIRVTGDRTTGRLLGAQLFGHRSAEIAKRVDTYATAIAFGATVADIIDLDLSYTPPLGSPWDAVQAAAMAWTLRQAA